jgi:hypothetical protein
MSLTSRNLRASLRALQSAARRPQAALRAQAVCYFSTSSLRPQSQGHLPGHPESPFLTSLPDSFFESVRANEGSVKGPDGKPGTGIPTYRLMDGTGKLLEGVSEESLEVCGSSETQSLPLLLNASRLSLPARPRRSRQNL